MEFVDISQAISSWLPAPRRCVEIGVLARDPIHELRDLGMRPQRFGGRVASLQFLVGEGGVDDAVADRVDGHRLLAAAALGDCVVPLHLLSQGTAAEEAGLF